MPDWITVCPATEMDAESVRRLDHAGRSYAVYRGPADDYYCTDGHCTHEAVHLADGLVMDYAIECPKHGGEFDYRSGEATRMPACRNLRTWPARCADGLVQIEV